MRREPEYLGPRRLVLLRHLLAHPAAVGPSVAAIVVIAVLGAACGQRAPDRPPGGSGAAIVLPGGEVTVGEGPPTPPVPFLADARLIGGPGTEDLALDPLGLPLSAHPAGGIAGWLAPVGVPSPDRKLVAYNSWAWYMDIDWTQSMSSQGIEDGQPIGAPSIRIVDLASGADTVLEEGAFSLAWRSDGAMAYFKGGVMDYRSNEPYLGDVLVRAEPGASPETWSAGPDTYVVAAWAGEHLLVYRELEGGGWELLALDGPGKSHVLTSLGSLVAVSPDGTRVLLYDGSVTPTTARLLATGSWEELSSLSLDVVGDASTGEPIRYLSYGGSWLGNRIAAEGGSGIVILDATGDKLIIESVLSFPKVLFPMSIHEPQFVDGSGTHVAAWAPLPVGGSKDPGRGYSYLDCELRTFTCLQGPLETYDVFYRVYNPSRPA